MPTLLSSSFILKGLSRVISPLQGLLTLITLIESLLPCHLEAYSGVLRRGWTSLGDKNLPTTVEKTEAPKVSIPCSQSVNYSLNLNPGVRFLGASQVSSKESICQCRSGRRRGEDPLEEEMATCFSVLAWEIPWTVEPGGLKSMRAAKSQARLKLTEHMKCLT